MTGTLSLIRQTIGHEDNRTTILSVYATSLPSCALDAPPRQGEVRGTVWNSERSEIDVALVFIAKDPNSDDDNCPTVWVDDQSGQLVVQGWDADAVTVERCLKDGPVPEGESVVRLPASMIKAIREACDVAERTDVR
ncbi:hypothetical protein [Streptomyces sp. NPDC058613]|uniref:hypothetical protein n=1 Tax=unclassified Streptomyces TaxID=2593676 RepID=UPI003669AD15